MFYVPDEVKLETKTEKGVPPTIILNGVDKELVGQIAAKIRAFRKPEPYKGKGIRFKGEEIRRKAGKTADGVTLASASTKDVSADGLNRVDQAKEVGKIMGSKAKSAKVEAVVFDRGGYLYHGRIQALAEGAREAGLKF
ncbi:UNVERIFIED_CONTAM: hypothetical protein GTU68_004253 [Idotea baltica]|nr:hypothetical protein [Idotea baltica]